MTRPLLPALAAALFLTACGPEAVDSTRPPRLVQVEAVTDSGPQNRYEFVGRVEARLSVDMAFQVGGQLADLPVAEGSPIAEGELVARLDQEDFERAQREARVQLQQARTDLDRQLTLFERGIASQAARDNAQTQFDLRAVALENAQRNLEYATLRAPFDGLVSRRLVDNYAIVAPGQAVVRIQDLSELRVSIPIPENMVATFDEEDLASIEAGFAFLPGQRFALEPRELVSEPDAASQTYRGILALPSDIPANILPGMTATVWAEVSDDAVGGSSIRIPVNAISYGPDGTPAVYVYDTASRRVARRVISTGEIDGDRVEVAAGLGTGELIVTAGVSALQDGMEVRPLGDSLAN